MYIDLIKKVYATRNQNQFTEKSFLCGLPTTINNKLSTNNKNTKVKLPRLCTGMGEQLFCLFINEIMVRKPKYRLG